MAQLFTNNSFATLAAGINSTVTSLTLATGTGGRFPTPTGGDFFDLTLTQAGDETSWEVVRCTARTGDVLTVTRSVEGTAAAWVTGDKAECRITASWLNSRRIAGSGTTDAVTHDKIGSAAYADLEQIALNIWPALISTAYQVTLDDRCKTLVVSGTTTITLPPASGAFSVMRPFSVAIKAVTGATVTVARSGSDTIETVTGDKTMTANTALTFFPTTASAWETI